MKLADHVKIADALRDSKVFKSWGAVGEFVKGPRI